MSTSLLSGNIVSRVVFFFFFTRLNNSALGGGESNSCLVHDVHSVGFAVIELAQRDLSCAYLSLMLQVAKVNKVPFGLAGSKVKRTPQPNEDYFLVLIVTNC